jgi:hypothetical protein
MVIGTEKDIDYTLVSEIERNVGHELQVIAIPYYEWETRKKNGDPFVQSVLAKHILFEGAEL